jgi:hypothetical protein
MKKGGWPAKPESLRHGESIAMQSPPTLKLRRDSLRFSCLKAKVGGEGS